MEYLHFFLFHNQNELVFVRFKTSALSKVSLRWDLK